MLLSQRSIKVFCITEFRSVIQKEKANKLGREVSETEIKNLKAEHPEKFKEILNLYKVFK